MTAPEQEPIRLTPGNRYLVREGRWSHGFREIIVREESRTAVKVQYQSGTRIWHPRQEVERWVIVEDLGPVVERDDTAELVEALEAYFEAKDNYMPEQDGFYMQADAALRAALAALLRADERQS